MIITQGIRRAWWGFMVVGSSFLLAGCNKQHAPPVEDAGGPPVSVRIVAAEAKSYPATEEIVGTVRAKLRASIEAKVSARIENMLVNPGQAVRAGELLLQLDPREIQSRLDQAVPVLRNTEIDLNRFRKLVEQKAVALAEFDAIESRHRVAQATVSEAETLLGYTRIVAPFSGVITRKLADVGDLAMPGKSLLEIEDPQTLRVETDVPESLIEFLHLGSPLDIKDRPGLNIIPGTVGEIAPAADSATRTFLVKLDMPVNAPVRAGQFARVAIPSGHRLALRVPFAALVNRGQMEIVFVAAAGNRAELRLVKTARRIADEVEIVSGLASGERVIVTDAENLRDGQSIEVKL